ncbi:hypothetical protein FIT74_04345 [Candidatus Methylopumilus universalis]|uniref:Uncharacterized protein n=1 Tax=Candidatus Methylopumilus universalis TaxID=2588536 RepID=A0ABX5VWN2_9PROT|nr:hypothetical protein [Candidatus Methylopumilus universalis]QDC51251.1 hypothetical protein FIT73_04295 [Candidatus Methylopumilus universalis]QDC61389.1 hypothetical protein FIT74_04345 [Candidatus Methylopumilus universalis]
MANEFIPCFPSLDSPGCGLSQREINFLIKGLPPFYNLILDSLSSAVAITTDKDLEPCKVILRESVVLITYLLLDRTLRLRKVISQQNLAELSVATQTYTFNLKSNANLLSLVDNSQQFNQYIFFRLASFVWQLPGKEVNLMHASQNINSSSIKNLNFDTPGLLTRIRRKIFRSLSARLGRVPALRLANIEEVLLDKGFYGIGKLKWLDPVVSEGICEKNLLLRQQVSTVLREKIALILSDDLFIRQIGMDKLTSKRAAEIFCELLVELIPLDSLEGIPNYLVCERHLKLISAPALFFCAMPGMDEIYWIAAARKLGIPVIGVQHGVHYGFVDHSCLVEMELAYCDYFVTWGWDEFSINPVFQKIHAIPLPSPWLSERTKRSRNRERLRKGQRNQRPYDVLLMSDRIQSFPPTINTLRVSRRDFLGQLNVAIWNIISELAKKQVRVLNKPFNLDSREMQSDVLNRLAAEYPNYYFEYQELNKGLSDRLLRSAWVIIWDEPGTGFFECLSSGVPSMLYWERLTTHEEEHARPYFQLLEEVGLLHTNAITLAEAVKNFLDAPEDWINNKNRCMAIQKVVERFSKVDDSWSAHWKDFMAGLTQKGPS